MIQFPPFQVDIENERVWKNGTEVRLRRKPFAILKHLVLNPQRLVTQPELVEAVWGKSIVMSESLLRTHVRDLRNALGEEIIETVVGRGYRFLPRVRYDGATTDATSAIVGRDAELEALDAALRRAVARQRSVVLVSGDAGVGKTSLIDAFVDRTRRGRDPWILRGACIERHGEQEPFLPVLEALAALRRGPAKERVDKVLAHHAPDWLEPQPSDEKRTGVLHEIASALEALSLDAPVIVTLDDLQWADASTIDLIALLARRIQPARILFVGAYRRGVPRAHALARMLGELVGHRRATEISLGSFDVPQVLTYIESRYQQHAFSNALASVLHRMTGGNALFIARLLDDWQARDVIREVDGRWTLDAELDDVASQCPEGIRRWIDVQIDRLDAPTQRAIEIASLLEPTFTTDLVARALDVSADEIEQLCESLEVEHSLFRRAGHAYAFTHALVRYAARARVTPSMARAWNQRIAAKAAFRVVEPPASNARLRAAS